MGHADTFAFETDYRPGAGADRFLAGTPPVLANAAFSAAADLWREVDPVAMDQRHRSLTDTLIQLFDEQCATWPLRLSSPRNHAQRGGHVALQFEVHRPWRKPGTTRALSFHHANQTPCAGAFTH